MIYPTIRAGATAAKGTNESCSHKIHVAFVSHSSHVPADLKRIAKETLGMPESDGIHSFNLSNEAEELLAALERNQIFHLILKKSLIGQFELKAHKFVDESSSEYVTVNYAEFKSALEAFEERKQHNLQKKLRKAQDERASSKLEPNSDAPERRKSKDTRGSYNLPRGLAKREASSPSDSPSSQDNNSSLDPESSPERREVITGKGSADEPAESKGGGLQEETRLDGKADSENQNGHASVHGASAADDSKDVATKNADPIAGASVEKTSSTKAVATKQQKPGSAKKSVATQKQKRAETKYSANLAMRFRVTPAEKKDVESKLGELRFSDVAREIFLHGKNLSDILLRNNSSDVVGECGRQITNIDQILDHQIDGLHEPTLEIRKVIERISKQKFKTADDAARTESALKVQGERLNSVSADLNTRRTSGRPPDADRQLSKLRRIYEDFLLIEKEL